MERLQMQIETMIKTHEKDQQDWKQQNMTNLKEKEQSFKVLEAVKDAQIEHLETRILHLQANIQDKEALVLTNQTKHQQQLHALEQQCIVK